MDASLMPFFWVAIALPLLLIMQRWINAHLQGIALLVMNKPERAIVIYALILLPGVILHELSHWLMAALLGVRTRSFSLMPRLNKDRTAIQLGYVEIYAGSSLGPIRESLIGGAPLLAGTAVILLISLHIFDVNTIAAAIQSGSVRSLIAALEAFFRTPNVLLWLYLLFAIANAMLPSPSDRRAWPAFLLILLVTAVTLYLLDLQSLLWQEVAGPVTLVFGYLGIALSMAIAVDLFFMLLIATTEGLISRIRGVSVAYNRSSRRAPALDDA